MVFDLPFLLCLACCGPIQQAGTSNNLSPIMPVIEAVLAPHSIAKRRVADPACATLRQCAEGAGILIGAAVRPDLLSDSQYIAMLSQEFTSITPESAMKYRNPQPEAGGFKFELADMLVNFATSNGQQIHGHTFLWHKSIPDWFTEASLTRQEALSIMEEFIQTTMERYHGRVSRWDVVNEVMDDDGQLRNNFWRRTIGDDYIEQVFRIARAADPSVQLFFNENGFPGPSVKMDSLAALITRLRGRGVPIDGIGVQSHVTMHRAPSLEQLIGLLEGFARLGVVVEITELDVQIPTPATESALARQAQVYGDMMAACLSVPACQGVTFWGLTDRYSWIDPLSHNGWGSALPFDSIYQPKPAYWAILNALRGGPN